MEISNLAALIHKRSFFHHLCSDSGVQITDFGKSWRDGRAFNYMLSDLLPGVVDVDALAYNSARTNLENAFSTAETHLGIPRLLDPEGLLYTTILVYAAQNEK